MFESRFLKHYNKVDFKHVEIPIYSLPERLIFSLTSQKIALKLGTKLQNMFS